MSKLLETLTKTRRARTLRAAKVVDVRARARRTTQRGASSNQQCTMRNEQRWPDGRRRARRGWYGAEQTKGRLGIDQHRQRRSQRGNRKLRYRRVVRDNDWRMTRAAQLAAIGSLRTRGPMRFRAKFARATALGHRAARHLTKVVRRRGSSRGQQHNQGCQQELQSNTEPTHAARP